MINKQLGGTNFEEFDNSANNIYNKNIITLCCRVYHRYCIYKVVEQKKFKNIM